MSNLLRAASIDDLRDIAKRRVPRFVFDFFEGAAESEAGMARNRDAFQRLRMVPRYLRNVQTRTTHTELFGRQWSMPLGIAPTGLTSVIWPDSDLLKARAAAKANIPFILSTVSNNTLEEVAAAAPGNTWFQLYVVKDRAIVEDLLRRAREAEIDVLVLTVDSPAHGKRERDVRNGFVLPFNLTLRNLLEFARCPAWSLAMARAGLPRFVNLEPYLPKNAKGALRRAEFVAQQAGGTFDWAELDLLRQAWPGKLVLKGVLSPEDVATSIEHGCDGVILSNHGGRQVDFGPAPIEMLPAAVAAAAGRIPVMLDSGIRRGSDILRAMALGGAFTFAGRAPLYGLAATGSQSGIDRALAILAEEMDRNIAQLGCTCVADLRATQMLRSEW